MQRKRNLVEQKFKLIAKSCTLKVNFLGFFAVNKTRPYLTYRLQNKKNIENTQKIKYNI